MTAQDAEKLVTKDLVKKSDLFAVMPEGTFETKKCFAVYYQTEEYIKTKDFGSLAVGHGAVLVDKITEKLYHTGSGRAAESYIESYEKYGNPFLQEDILRLNITFNKSDLNNKLDELKLIKAITGQGISDAKEILKDMKNGEIITIPNHISIEQRIALLANGFKISHPLKN